MFKNIIKLLKSISIIRIITKMNSTIPLKHISKYLILILNCILNYSKGFKQRNIIFKLGIINNYNYNRLNLALKIIEISFMYYNEIFLHSTNFNTYIQHSILIHYRIIIITHNNNTNNHIIITHNNHIIITPNNHIIRHNNNI